MCVFYYRAYDEYGEEKKGIVDAQDERSADRRLRRTGLKPFFICDYAAAKHAVANSKEAKRRKSKVRRILVAGVLLVPAAIGAGAWIERWAGRAVAPDIGKYTESGVLAGASHTIYGATPEEHALALEFAALWESVAPGTLDGLEASTFLVAVHVNDGIVGVDQADTESLMAQFLRAMRRRFGVRGPSVLLVYAENPLVEAVYDEAEGAVLVTYY